MTDNGIPQLDAGALTTLFRDSLPSHPHLTPQQAHMAALMHRAGRDAGAIAERTEASLGSVLTFLDQLRKLEAKRAAGEAAAAQEDGPEPQSVDAPVVATIDRQPEPATALPPMPERRPAPRDTRPDVELTGLQISLIRRMRKVRVSADTIARVMRLSPDQVLRVAGEIP